MFAMKRLLRLAAALLLLSPAAALAAQATVTMPTSGPMAFSTFVSTYLNPGLTALLGCSSGTSAPAVTGQPAAFQCWVDTSSTPRALKIYDGASWLTIGTIDTSGHAWAAKLVNSTDLPLATGVTGVLGSSHGGAGSITGALKGNGAGVVSAAACGDLSNAAASCSTDATNANNISSGTLAAARGGAGSISGALKGNGAGVVSAAACGDLSNAAASCSTDATNATNISSGTLAAARGGAGSISGALKGNGSGVVSAAACGDLSNAAASCSTDATNATNIASGTLAGARMSAVNLAAAGSGGVTGTLALGNGGTGQTTAAAARGSSGLNIEAVTSHGDSNYSIVATDRTIITSASLTAARTWTLPAASAVNPGQQVDVRDAFGGINGANTLTVQRAGSDTINGATSALISTQYGGIAFKSDGVSGWSYVPSTGGGGGGGVSNVTIAAGVGINVVGTCSITTSGTCTIATAYAPGASYHAALGGL